MNDMSCVFGWSLFDDELLGLIGSMFVGQLLDGGTTVGLMCKVKKAQASFLVGLIAEQFDIFQSDGILGLSK